MIPRARRALHRRRFGVLVAGLLSLLLVSAPLISAPQAVAAAGSWGAGGYPYLAGSICTTDNGTSTVTSPLVAWDLGSGRSPGFLTSTITSDGATDSAAPPLPSVGPQTTGDVTAGSDGFTSAQDIATYAALISRYGSGDAAEVADAIARKASGSSAGCTDTGREAAILADAQASAGPYAVSFDDHAKRLLPATATPVSVTVRSAAGNAVPGATVAFSSGSAQLSSATATTDAQGVATVQATLPARAVAATAGTVDVEAQVALPTGLQTVDASATPSATDPSGSVATGLVAAPATPVTATGTFAVDLSAHPVMHLAVPTRALDIGSSDAPRAVVTGMYGHRASVVFTIHGPVGVRSGTLCSDRTAGDAGSRVAATSTVTITGDSTVAAGTWQPSTPGCYWVTAALTTLDAVPKATAHASAGGPVTVLDTSAQLAVAKTVVAAGSSVVGTTTVKHGYGLAGAVDLRLIGPVQPDPDAKDCTGVSFDHAAVNTAAPAQLPANGSTQPTASVDTAGGGCYELAGSLDVTVPGSGDMRVPLDTTGNPTVLAVAPAVTYSMTQLWSYTHGTVSADVTVLGTYNQPVHVALRTVRSASPDLNCRGADFPQTDPNSDTAPAPTGTGVAAHRNLQTVAVSTPPLTRTGCYEAVPVLTVDANRDVTATGTAQVTSAIAVGVNPNASDESGPVQRPTGGGDTLQPLLAGIGFLLLCLAAMTFGLATARRMARDPSDVTAEPLLLP